jgi:hypothetical protein
MGLVIQGPFSRLFLGRSALSLLVKQAGQQ